ncbi:MAG: phosphate/phosphite/phosphonate ABC transporter substrate-binding protein [Magnetococcales bacterium]|nr:phosphate/phosphite/phosphonate ABC transporter substrate-binding protein [Magnetococcales bacterium]NGZ29181.1 phosphate/phosphite/phosphonate ABC transporter substrate-binding protein [Magnetococcales bacterium]
MIIGNVSIYPKEEARQLKPMVDYAVSRMSDVGIRRADFYIARNRQEMVQALREGKVDWVTDTPFPILDFSQQTGGEMLARRWKKGVEEYYSVFVTPKGSGISDLSDLVGKKIVFQDKDSSSAYFAPSAILLEQGYALQELSSPHEEPDPDRIGVVFGKEETFNQIAWMRKGMAKAAAMSILDWQELSAQIKGQMVIFAKSQPFPRGVEMVRRDLSPTVKARLKEVLLKAHEDPLAADALRSYSKTSKFDEITPQVEESLSYVRRLLILCQGC